MNNRLIHIILPVIATLFFVAIAGSVMFDNIIPQAYSYNGIVVDWSIPTIENNIVGILVNCGMILLTATLLTKMATHFQLVKEQTLLPLLFFVLFQLLTPGLINQFAPINAVSLIAFMLVGILYTCYQESRATEKGFIIALALSSLSLVDAHILYFLPILVIGIVQMQAATPRTFAAMLVGLVTPYWLVWGLGIITLSQLNFAALAIPLQMPNMTLSLLPIGVIMLMGFVMGIGNLYNAFNEKIYTRATNGFINLLSTYTAILLIIDNTNCVQYLPILSGCVSLQACYFFSTRTKRASTIALLILVALLVAWIGWIYWGNYPL